ncbi:hypothetical protein SEA_FRANKIE_40 [Mycobacterium phage Frankie]|nr:hypothetical protein SEA_FRANKIE_40 [Mycobacterium phage Frankie]
MHVPRSCCDGGIPVGRAQNVGATVKPVGQPGYVTDGLVNRYWDESDDE